MPDDALTWAAYHEAGHVLASHAHGRLIDRAHVEVGGDGVAVHRTPDGVRVGDRAWYEAELTIDLAGAAAVARDMPAAAWDGVDSDLERAWRLARELVGAHPTRARAVGEEIERAWGRALLLVAGLRVELDHLAARFERSRTLEGEQLRDAIDKALAAPEELRRRAELRASIEAGLAAQQAAKERDDAGAGETVPEAGGDEHA